jgi:DNA-binding NarL/FixJ family response regulator
MLRAVIVDDNPGFLAAARGVLERGGVAVVGVASTGDQAIARIQALGPDVTLLDIDLGAESGFEVARRLHQHADVSSPVILISTYDEQDYADLIAASPALGFLAKSALSAGAVRDLLESRGGAGAGGAGAAGAVTEPPGK